MKNQHEQLNRFFSILDILTISFTYIACWYFYIYMPRTVYVGTLSDKIYFSALIIIIPIYIILYNFFELYSGSRSETRLHEFYHILEANIIGLLILNTILFLGSKNAILFNFSRALIIIFGIANIFIEFLTRNVIRAIIRRIRKKGINLKHILLVGYSDATFRFIDKIYKNPGWGFKIYGIVDDKHKIGDEYRKIKILGNINDLQKIIQNNDLDEIVITLSLDEYVKLDKVVSVCEKSGVHTKFIPDYGTIIPSKPVTEDYDGLPVINIRAVPLLKFFNSFIKRIIDIIGSIVGIILFSPIMIIIAILVKATSKGPIIFKQERIGRHNKKFVMFKFRSMVEQDDKEEKNKWTTKDDPRTTKIGKFIRKVSFDELPQFLNVLMGDMSLVGPRPEREQYVEKFKETIPRYMIKHQVRPGMTGWAQINGLRGDTPIDKRIQYDLWYIENWTLGLDIKILILTIFVGFANKNAY